MKLVELITLFSLINVINQFIYQNFIEAKACKSNFLSCKGLDKLPKKVKKTDYYLNFDNNKTKDDKINSNNEKNSFKNKELLVNIGTSLRTMADKFIKIKK